MKYLVILGDGMADLPLPALNGKTPLQVAKTPHMDRLATHGVIGLAQTLFEGYPLGSDVANMAVLGYDPKRYFSGRAPLEAAGRNIALAASDLALRINLVSVVDGKMHHYASERINDEDAYSIVETLQEQLNSDQFTIHAGTSYKHLLAWHHGPDGLILTAPHDIMGQAIEHYLPQGVRSDELRHLMEKSKDILAEHPVNRRRLERGEPAVSMIWPQGAGRTPQVPTLRERFGIKGAAVAAVDLIFGLATYAGLTRIDVTGATGYTDTNYRGKADATLKAFDTFDFVFLHVEAPDEASHDGDLAAKIAAIEAIDRDIVGPILAGLESDTRILLMPDHATPVSLRTHIIDPVPYCLTDVPFAHAETHRSYDEQTAAASGILIEEGYTLIEKLFA